MKGYTYVQVVIWQNVKLMGKVLFEPGQGDNDYYIKRADILSKPYLLQDIKHLALDFKVNTIKSKEKKVIEFFIPSIED